MDKFKQNTLNVSYGYIALISAIVISAVLLIISVSLGTCAFFLRANVLDAESKQRSRDLAEGCMQSAIINWALGQSTNLSNINIGGNICTILSVQNNMPISGQFTIVTFAAYGNTITNIKAVVTNINLSLVSLVEF